MPDLINEKGGPKVADFISRGTIPQYPKVFCKGKDKAWIVLTVREMAKLFIIILAVLMMSNATVSFALETVPAIEIIAKVQNNLPVNYEDVNISGDLDLGRLNPAEVHSAFSIVNSTVQNASFNGVSFEKDVSFWGTTFFNVGFNKTTFLENSDFSKVSFHRASFMDAAFVLPVIFDGAEFQENISFEESQFLQGYKLQ